MQIGGQTYKNHLDGYNQMDLMTGKGPSARHELFYFGESQLGAIRIDDFKFQFYQQPFGWPGEKVTTDMPTIINLRQDPFERTSSIRGQTLNDLGRRLHERLHGARVLALRPSAADRGGGGAIVHRLSRRCSRPRPSTSPPIKEKIEADDEVPRRAINQHLVEHDLGKPVSTFPDHALMAGAPRRCAR